MTINEISKAEYDNKIPIHSEIIYNKSDFIELNSYKVDTIYYLLFSEKKKHFTVAVGIRDNQLLLPFSAPFSFIQPIGNSPSVEYYEMVIDALDKWVKQKQYSSVSWTLPPYIYGEKDISVWLNILYRFNYNIKYNDLNFYINLDSNDYLSRLHRNAKKNLNIAIKLDLAFRKCITEIDYKNAYSIIQKNRNAKGYPLHMTYEQVRSTIDIVKSDFFIVEKSGLLLAAALCFYVSSGIVQVIYWGDIPGYSEYKSINFLAYKLVNYYKEKEIHILDIGPSTEYSVPNYGLCDFKESIGCEICNKVTVTKQYI